MIVVVDVAIVLLYKNCCCCFGRCKPSKERRIEAFAVGGVSYAIALPPQSRCRTVRYLAEKRQRYYRGSMLVNISPSGL